MKRVYPLQQRRRQFAIVVVWARKTVRNLGVHCILLQKTYSARHSPSQIPTLAIVHLALEWTDSKYCVISILWQVFINNHALFNVMNFEVKMANKEIIRNLLLMIMVIIYLLVGVAHIRSPEGFLAITPGWVPFPEAVIFWTGVAEILGAVGLCISKFRKAAGIGLALYALCVFPANIHHALNNIAVEEETLSWWYHAPRLAFQPIAIWWALWVSKNIEWPFRK